MRLSETLNRRGHLDLQNDAEAHLLNLGVVWLRQTHSS